MPKARRETSNSTARRNNLGVQLTDEEYAAVVRIAEHYAHSLSSAGRMLIIAALPDYDPEQRKP